MIHAIKSYYNEKMLEIILENVNQNYTEWQHDIKFIKFQ